jgi:hypothetical protein
VNALPLQIHADPFDSFLAQGTGLSPARRLAFGRWVRSVYGLVEHLDQCPFGCTAEQQRCADGVDVVDLERIAWEDWRASCSSSRS